MYCRMIRGIYLRCNGEMACYCGPGEEITLGNLPLDSYDYDFISGYYNNEQHRAIRHNMANNILPYPGVCLKCIYLDPLKPSLVENTLNEIEWMHIEATSQCNLNCSFCIPQSERATFRPKPFFIPPRLYKKIIDDIKSHDMNVKWMYFSGRGEAGLHNEAWDLVSYAKRNLTTDFLINTNGNISYTDQIIESGLDKIKIAIDGTTQNSYAAYRQNGQLKKILDLTRNISSYKHRNKLNKPKIIWQYILFTHNDSPEDLIRIQEMALEHGVDELLFKTTFTHNYSCSPLESITRLHPNLKFLDIKRMVSIDINTLRKSLLDLKKYSHQKKHNKVIVHGIDLAKQIFRSFILGIEKKQLYNHYGNNPDASLITALASKDKRYGREIIESLQWCLESIAASYVAIDMPRASVFYADFANQLSIANPTTPYMNATHE